MQNISNWDNQRKSVITNCVQVTVCAVAQHCYNGDVSFLWEKWKL